MVPVTELNVSLGVVATVKNPNYGSFSYGDSTTSVFYRGNEVAEGPIHGDTIPSHGEVNVSTTLDVTADKFAKDPNFFNDVKSGVVNLTSSTTLHGKVKILSLFKLVGLEKWNRIRPTDLKMGSCTG
ncbi:late embryogenesis abundant protein [Senna tora]|uniref:Late embryogenesis abundant protein n=1 Tax=Senna tora TaxID=362788 RepID=A0A834T765_9FABA|nr:late embryogenesis abundant protein [Senna tora]